MRRAGTIIARNYWAHARVLARSLETHHPEVRLCVLVIDGDADTKRIGAGESFDVLTPDDIGLDPGELHRMAGIYDLLEFATAVKPWFLRRLLDEGATSVIYLDPDIEVFAPIDEAWALAEEHGIVVTPHTTTPPSADDRGHAEELTILGSGAYNLGFIAVGADARPFLDWWAERLRRDGLIAKDASMFVDQRWVDLAPSYYDVHILRGAGWNVAYWNLPVRRLTRDSDGYRVDGEPLRFFHYSGYSPDRSDELSCYESDPPKTKLEEHPVLAELCHGYGERLLMNGLRAYARIPYGYARTRAGLPLDRYARRLYRRALLASVREGTREPPDPFGPKPAVFERWLREPAGAHGVTRYMRALYDERADLQASFRNLNGPEARFYVDWAHERGRFEPNVDPELVALRVHRARDATPRGVNVAGYVRAESGVGEVSRLLVNALDAAEIPCVVVPFEKTSSRQEGSGLQDRSGEPAYATNIVCVNADAFPGFVEHAGDGFFSGRRTVAVWQWEVERFPDWMAASQQWVDEIWVSSEHAARAIRAETSTPVYVFPPPIVAREPGHLSALSLDVPDGFLFLFCFDFDSVFERKNPLGVVEAFCRAFEAGSGPQLLIKSVRGDAHPEQLERLRGAAAERSDVHVHDGYLPADEQAALMASCDAYVSLHRSEGFGLTVAEAMALGKPVIATGYSGNLEFMDDTNSWLIPYELVPIGEGNDPYPAEARWAQPDIDLAADAMRQVFSDPDTAIQLGRRAAEDVARLHSPASRAPFLLERLRAPTEFAAERAEVERLRAATAPEPPWTPVESVVHYVADGPDVRSPTRYGALSRLARRAVMRAARHFMQHQEKVQSSLLSSVQDLQARLKAEVEASRELEGRVRDLSERLDREAERARVLGQGLAPVPEASVPAVASGGRVHRMRSYAGLFAAGAPVLAVGHQAEDLIDLLGQEGVEAFALHDADADVGAQITDVLDGMERLPDRSLGGILTIRVIEHLSVVQLQCFLELSRRKLDAGGVLVAETEDVRGAHATGARRHGAHAPGALLELCRSTGFEQAYVLFPSGTGATTSDEDSQGEFAIVASVLQAARS